MPHHPSHDNLPAIILEGTGMPIYQVRPAASHIVCFEKGERPWSGQLPSRLCQNSLNFMEGNWAGKWVTRCGQQILNITFENDGILTARYFNQHGCGFSQPSNIGNCTMVTSPTMWLG